MKNKRILIVCCLVGLIVSASIIITNFSSNGKEESSGDNTKSLRVVSSHATMKIYENLPELEKNTDIILKGKKLEEIDKIIEKDDEDLVIEYYTKSKINVEKIYKNESSSKIPNEIIIVENFAVDRDTLYTLADYEPMIENKKYLLFLRESEPGSNLYVIKGVFFGKVPLDNEKLEFKGDKIVKEKYSKIVNEAKSKFGD